MENRDTQEFESRKKDHLKEALNPLNQAHGHAGLERVHLYHDALPDLDFSEISLKSLRLGKTARVPFYIAGMTAGHYAALSINDRLASCCEARGWALGLGSQRRDIEFSDSLDQWRNFRKRHPNLVLIANLGISQLIKTPLSAIQELVKEVGANAIAIHLNALQEVIQYEGTPSFKGALWSLKNAIEHLNVPVIVKETGCGFSSNTLHKIKSLPLAAIDVSGLGGTHWGRIEGRRVITTDLRAPAAETFANWGESTLQSVLACKDLIPETTEIWASGGVRSGLDAAKLIALGAKQVGFAQPALVAALESDEKLLSWMELIEFELKIALFCTNHMNPLQLRMNKNAWTMT